jgi:hypothetical protein
MWNETWGTLLLGIVLLMLLKQDISRRAVSPVVLGTLVSWLYFVRPTYSVHIFAVTIYLTLFHRQHILRYLITGAMWLAGFMIYSWRIYHHLVPSYYRPGRLHFAAVWAGLAGNLLSPSRGLLVCVPTLLFVGYLLVRYRREIKLSKLVALALFVIVTHLVATSATLQWWGGHAFGPRFTTGLVPWFVLLSTIGVQAMLAHGVRQRRSNARGRIELTAGVTLLVLSIMINGLGAVDRATWAWNMRPSNIDQHPERLWDWRQPQSLAGLFHPPLPAALPALRFGSIDFSKPESDSYVWYGWSASETQYRWTEGTQAALIFSIEKPRDILLTIKFVPFLVASQHQSQRVAILLNGKSIDDFTADNPSPGERTVTLPANFLVQKNSLRFVLPDAVSPSSLGLSHDDRLLGLAVYWMRFQTRTIDDERENMNNGD